MKKLIGLDIDGTLVNSKLEITPKTKAALEKAQDLGHILVIASGRAPHGVYRYAKELNFDKHNGLLSNFNGGRITNFQKKQAIINHPLNFNLTKEILEFAENLDIDYCLLNEGKIYSNKKNTYRLEESALKNNMEIVIRENLSYNLDFEVNNILFSQKEDRIDEPAKKLMEKFGKITSQIKSMPYYYEIMPQNISKGRSLMEIAKYYGIDEKDTIAFGDEENDISMIKMAGTGVVMANGSQKVKELADYITKSNDNDGIAYYLENFVF